MTAATARTAVMRASTRGASAGRAATTRAPYDPSPPSTDMTKNIVIASASSIRPNPVGPNTRAR
jgi:hypothetical protein